MKKILCSWLVISLLMVGSALAAPAKAEKANSSVQNIGVGIADMTTVVSKSTKLKVFQEQLNQKGKELSDQLEIDKANLSAEEFQAKQQAVYGEFMHVKREIEKQFDSLLKQAMGEVAKEKNLTVILYKNGVVYGGIDVTQDIINKLQ